MAPSECYTCGVFNVNIHSGGGMVYFCVDPYEPEGGYKLQTVCGECIAKLGDKDERKHVFDQSAEYSVNFYKGKLVKTKKGRWWYKYDVNQLIAEGEDNNDDYTWKDANDLLSYRENK